MRKCCNLHPEPYITSSISAQITVDQYGFGMLNDKGLDRAALYSCGP